MFCGTATGELLPLYVVYKAGRVWSTWKEGGPEGTKYDCTKSGWFDKITFENWFFRILLPHARNRPGPKVVICDNLLSHVNERVIHKCRKHSIKFVFLPSNSTHLTQPLDVAFFGPTKRNWRDILGHWKDTVAGQRAGTLPKCEFPNLLKQLWNALQPNASARLISGFQTCGIFPCDVEPLLNRLPRLQSLDLTAIGNGFRKYVEDKRKELIDTPIRKRKQTNAVAG